MWSSIQVYKHVWLMHSHPWVRFYSALFISALHHYTFGECRYILLVLQPCILMQISFLSLGIRQGCTKRREYLAQTHGQYIWCYLYDVTCVFCSFRLSIFECTFTPANICFQNTSQKCLPQHEMVMNFSYFAKFAKFICFIWFHQGDKMSNDYGISNGWQVCNSWPSTKR